MTVRWSQAGQFEINIPSGWEVRQLDDSTEIYPLAGDAAIHVSSFRKSRPSVPTSLEARQLFNYFVGKNVLFAEESAIHPKQRGGTWTCQALCKADGVGDRPAIWFVKVICTSHRGIVGTMCLDDANSESLAEGAAILESLNSHEDESSSSSH